MTTDSKITACTVLDRAGEPCGRAGDTGLPLGVCPECAIRIFRAVCNMIEIRRTA